MDDPDDAPAPAEAPEPPRAGPLANLRIVDLSGVLMGPFATQQLADLGADVIKIESLVGDTTRQVPPARAGTGSIFTALNRGKRSVVLDLKAADGRAALLALVGTADIFVSNVRPKALARLGLSPEALLAAAPRLIVVSLTGYGQNGPYPDLPAYEDLIQGMVALPSLTARSGAAQPLYVPVSICDRTVGMHAAMAMLAAVIARDRTGRGQAIEVPMFEVMAQYVLSDHLGGRSFDPPVGEAGYNRILTPERRPYATADGTLCVLIYTDDHWRRFGAAIARHDAFAADPRLASLATRTTHTQAICRMLAEILRERTTADWLALLQAADIPACRLNSLDDLIDDPHLAATGLISLVETESGTVRQLGVPTRWSDTIPRVDPHVPALGEHTAEILAAISDPAARSDRH